MVFLPRNFIHPHYTIRSIQLFYGETPAKLYFESIFKPLLRLQKALDTVIHDTLSRMSRPVDTRLFSPEQLVEGNLDTGIHISEAPVLL